MTKEKAQEKSNPMLEVFENWSFSKMTKDEQLTYLQDNLVPAMFTLFTQQNNDIEEIVVYEGIYDVVVEAMDKATIPEALKTSDTPEEFEKKFSGYCASKILHRVSLERLEVPNPASVPPDGLFIRIRTKADREYETVVRWGMETGYLAWLEQQATKLMPNLQELRLIYFTAKFYEAMAAQQSRIQAATSNEFGMKIQKP